MGYSDPQVGSGRGTCWPYFVKSPVCSWMAIALGLLPACPLHIGYIWTAMWEQCLWTIVDMLSTYTFLSLHFTCTAPWHAWQIRQRSNLLRVRQDVTVGWTARARKPLHKADNDNVMCQNSASVALKTGVKCRTDKSLIQAHCGIFTCKTSYRKLRSKFWSSEIRLPS